MDVSYFSKLTGKCASVTVPNSQQTPYGSLKKNTRLNLLKKIVDIYREKHVTHESTIWTKKQKLWKLQQNVYGNQYDLKNETLKCAQNEYL